MQRLFPAMPSPATAKPKSWKPASHYSKASYMATTAVPLLTSTLEFHNLSSWRPPNFIRPVTVSQQRNGWRPGDLSLRRFPGPAHARADPGQRIPFRPGRRSQAALAAYNWGVRGVYGRPSFRRVTCTVMRSEFGGYGIGDRYKPSPYVREEFALLRLYGGDHRRAIQLAKAPRDNHRFCEMLTRNRRPEEYLL